MLNLNSKRTFAQATLSLCFVGLLSACGGSGGGADPQQPQSDAIIQGNDSGPVAEAPAPVDTGTAEFTPSLGNNIEIAYADPTQPSNNEFIEAQWLHMQNCLQVSAQEPVVTVVEDKITPVTSNDDVVRHIDGQIQASSNVSETDASIQVRSADFDGSLGKPGLYLRSIMGRYLWFANDLAERDYEFECAKGS